MFSARKALPETGGHDKADFSVHELLVGKDLFQDLVSRQSIGQF